MTEGPDKSPEQYELDESAKSTTWAIMAVVLILLVGSVFFK